MHTILLCGYMCVYMDSGTEQKQKNREIDKERRKGGCLNNKERLCLSSQFSSCRNIICINLYERYLLCLQSNQSHLYFPMNSLV